ncbi:MAG: hypothetical protein A3G76_03170 [Acidobacteria bacterium RIFCSPLOWO2_12_FULL_65_11]|nr:MAG: hypothetical protein A3G76_03170 [Acidobacteria bacterium RIFCSPLOWO2_12_FULL_65_11]
MRRLRPLAGAAALLTLAAAPPARADIGDYLGRTVASVSLVLDGRETTDPAFVGIVETRVGRPLSMFEVRESIAHLFSLGRFEGVSADASMVEAGVALRYELSPIRLVSRIEFTGKLDAPGIDVGQLRRAITNRYGSSPRLSLAGDVTTLVRDALRQRGYRRPGLRPRADMRESGQATLVFDVDPGPRTIIGAIDVLGAPAVSRADLLRQFGVKTGDPYEPEALTARIASYVDRRHSQRYYETQVLPTVSFSDDERVANLALTVTPGPRVTVNYAGDSMPSDQLAELVPIEREGSADEDLLEDSTRRIAAYLRGQGYREATATFTRDSSDGELSITFTVFKGPQYVIERVDFSGDVSRSRAAFEPRLRLRQGAPFSAASRDADKAAIEAFYRLDGFRGVRVDFYDEPGTSILRGARVPVVVRVAIVEGVRTVVGDVGFEGNASISEGVLRACSPDERDLRTCPQLQPGVPYFEPQLQRDSDAIALRYANLGFRTATVAAGRELTPDGTRADLVFTVQEGPRLLLDHVLIAGNLRTNAEIIERELQIKPGEPLGLAARDESQRRLAALGLFRQVEIKELRHNSNTLWDWLITVEEAPPTTIGYGGGLEGRLLVRRDDSSGAATQKFEVAPRAFFEIGRRNLFGKNRSVNLSTSVSLYPKDSPSVPNSADTTGGFAFAEYRVLGTLREPRVFGTAGDGLLTATIERQIRSSFNLSRRGAAAQLARPFTTHVSLGAGYQIQRTELLDVQNADQQQLLIDRVFTQVRLSSLFASGVYSTRNDPVDPSAGEYVSVTAQVAARRIGSEIGFAKSSFTAQAFRAVPGANRIVLAGSARLGLATGFPRDVVVVDDLGQPSVQSVRDLPQAERFFAGGDTTVRGFALDRLGTTDTIRDGFPIGGNALAILNGELRVPLLSSLGVVGFWDVGNVFAHVVDVDLRKLRSAVGFGLRVRTPIGPIRVDWGYKMDSRPGDLARPDSIFVLGASAAFISFGQAF